MKKVYLAKKDGRIIHHTDFDAMQQLDCVKPEKTVTIEEWEAAGSTAYFDAAGKIVLGIPADEASKQQEIAELEAEEKKLQSKLDSKDYKVIQASERGQVFSQIDPTLHQERELSRQRINEIRARLVELGVRKGS